MSNSTRENSNSTILIAENNDLALNNYRDILLGEGFSIVTATNPHKTREILDSHIINLALIDWRLEDDQDENDNSGLQIVREYGDSTPIILMTLLNRNTDHLRRAFIPELNHAAPVDFFIKGQDTSERLIDAVKKNLAKRKIFIVHGRNQKVLDEVTELLNELNLAVIVLQEQPARSRTIIENLERHLDVSYAIVLLTGDDEGRLKQDAQGVLKPRPRQNVILELGLFVGHLGRDRVVSLCESNIDFPSDWAGVTYISLSRDWRNMLKNEMLDAGVL